MAVSAVVVKPLYAGHIALGLVSGGIGATPDQFTFVDQEGIALSATDVESNVITLTGFGIPQDVTFGETGHTTGEYRRNGGAWTDLATFEAQPNDTIQLRLDAGAGFRDTRSITVTVGGVSDTWSVTTIYELEFTAQPTNYGVQDVRAIVRFTPSGENPITYRVVVLADGTTAPSAQDVLDLTGTAASPVSESGLLSTSRDTITATAMVGLSDTTAYDAYVAIDDTASSPVLGTLTEFTTTPPRLGPVGSIQQSRVRVARRYPTKV